MCKLIILSFLLIILSSCTRVGSGAGMFNSRADDRFFPVTVRSVPDGFISLSEALADKDGIMTRFFWSYSFGFQDSEGVTIFQTDVKNNEFIVMYGDEYYINEEKFLEISSYAKNIYEQMNHEYGLGDEIQIRGVTHGNRTIFSIKIISVDRVNASDGSVYEIKFSVYPDVSEGHLLEMFNSVETVSGEKYFDFVLVDINTVHVEIESEAQLCVIVLSNFERTHARSTFQNSIRRVVVNDC